MAGRLTPTDNVLLEFSRKSKAALANPKSIFLPKKGAALLSMSIGQRLA